MWDHRAQITEVHDGDSVTVYQDDGRDEFAELKIRLFGTFAPELKQVGGPETQKFAADWVAKHSVSKWPFTVVMIRNKANTDEETTFGRFVAMIIANDTQEYLNVAVSAFVTQNGYPRGTGG